jgi:hypothetical protein
MGSTVAEQHAVVVVDAEQMVRKVARLKGQSLRIAPRGVIRRFIGPGC